MIPGVSQKIRKHVQLSWRRQSIKQRAPFSRAANDVQITNNESLSPREQRKSAQLNAMIPRLRKLLLSNIRILARVLVVSLGMCSNQVDWPAARTDDLNVKRTFCRQRVGLGCLRVRDEGRCLGRLSTCGSADRSLCERELAKKHHP